MNWKPIVMYVAAIHLGSASVAHGQMVVTPPGAAPAAHPAGAQVFTLERQPVAAARVQGEHAAIEAVNPSQPVLVAKDQVLVTQTTMKPVKIPAEHLPP